jgi:hypothetical protein
MNAYPVHCRLGVDGVSCNKYYRYNNTDVRIPSLTSPIGQVSSHRNFLVLRVLVPVYLLNNQYEDLLHRRPVSVKMKSYYEDLNLVFHLNMNGVLDSNLDIP